MIKIIAIGIWIVVATLGSGYVAASMSAPTAPEVPPDPTYFAGLDYRTTEVITVPIIAENAIRGYVLAAFVYTIDGETAGKLAVPPDPFILDEAFRAVYSASGFDFQKAEQFDLVALTGSIRDAVNARYKQEVIHEVLIQQFDFLPKEDVGGEGLQKLAPTAAK
jgi:flagellar basal body-associated protein FliL